MLALALFVVVVAGVAAKVRYGARWDASELGSMSRQWVVAHNAAEPTWSR